MRYNALSLYGSKELRVRWIYHHIVFRCDALRNSTGLEVAGWWRLLGDILDLRSYLEEDRNKPLSRCFSIGMIVSVSILWNLQYKYIKGPGGVVGLRKLSGTVTEGCDSAAAHLITEVARTWSSAEEGQIEGTCCASGLRHGGKFSGCITSSRSKTLMNWRPYGSCNTQTMKQREFKYSFFLFKVNPFLNEMKKKMHVCGYYMDSVPIITAEKDIKCRSSDAGYIVFYLV